VTAPGKAGGAHRPFCGTDAVRLCPYAQGRVTHRRARTAAPGSCAFTPRPGLLASGLPLFRSPAQTTDSVVDPHVVVNRRQAEQLLVAVSYQGRIGPRLVAFFACLYYAGTRPGETVELREDVNLDLPEHGWGTLYLRAPRRALAPAGHNPAAGATAAS
jgi:integrase